MMPIFITIPISILIIVLSTTHGWIFHYFIPDLYFLLIGILSVLILYQKSKKNLKKKGNRELKNVLIYGTSGDSRMILYKIKTLLPENNNILGFINEYSSENEKMFDAYPIIHSHQQLINLLQSKKIDHIFVSNDIITGELLKLNEIISGQSTTIIQLQLSLKNLISDSLNKSTISSKMVWGQIFGH